MRHIPPTLPAPPRPRHNKPPISQTVSRRTLQLNHHKQLGEPCAPRDRAYLATHRGAARGADAAIAALTRRLVAGVSRLTARAW